jgi:pentapeptide MXKDX repeat protein
MTGRFGISAVALLLSLSVAPLAGQQTDTMAKEGMAKEGMAKDGMMNDHDAMAMAPHGSFAGAEGHRAKGSYEMATAGGKTQLKLGADFSVEKGPDVHVVLSPAAKVPAKGSLFLGKLTRFEGAQTFDVPAGTDLGKYTHVVLWCRKYSVAMGTAPLAAGGEMMDK